MIYLLSFLFFSVSLNAGNAIRSDFLNPHSFLHGQISRGDYFGARQSIKLGTGVHQVYQGINTLECVAKSAMPFKQQKELAKGLVDKNVPVTNDAIKLAQKSKNTELANYLVINFMSQSSSEQTASAKKVSTLKKIKNAVAKTIVVTKIAKFVRGFRFGAKRDIR